MPKRTYSETRKKRTKHLIIEGLKNNLGILTPVLKQVEVAYNTYRKWEDEDPDFKKEVSNIQEGVIDWVESKLFENIKENDKASIIFYLKTKAKHRGYIERAEIDQTTRFSEPLKLNIVLPEQTLIEGQDKKQLDK